MNVYTTGRPASVIPIQEPHNANSPGVLDKLDLFVSAAKQLESSLGQEQNRSRQLQQALHESRLTYDRLLKELEIKNQELTIRDSKLKSELTEHQEKEKLLIQRLQVLSMEFKKVRSELAHYKAAWANVLQREREAKYILQDSEKTAKRLTEIETRAKSLDEALVNEKIQREQAERHSKSYQSELQNVLVRLHSAEAKFSEISRELHTLSQAKKSMDEEVANIERSMRERFQWETIKEREKIRAQLEKEAALERERYREELRERFLKERQELERELGLAKIAQTQAQDDLSTQRKTTEELKKRIDELHSREREFEATIEQLNGELQLRLKAQLLKKEEEHKKNLELALHLKDEKLDKALEQERQSAEQKLLQTEWKFKAQMEAEQERLRSLRSSIFKSGWFILSNKTRIATERDYFEAAFNAEIERSQSLESMLVSEKERFEEAISELESELDGVLRPLVETLPVELTQKIEEHKKKLRQVVEFNTCLAEPTIELDELVHGQGPALDC